MKNPVLLVDDDAAVRDALGQSLELGGYSPILAAGFLQARDHITPGFAGVIVSDIRMPGKDGFALLDHVKSRDADLPVIFLTGEGDVPTAVRGLREGAFDFLEKPCDPKHLLEVVEKALRTRKLVLENRRLKVELEQAQYEKIGFLGLSPAAQKLREAVRLAGRVRSAALICGEPGTGRGHVARLIAGLRFDTAALQLVDCQTGPDGQTLPAVLPRDPVLFANVDRLTATGQARLLALLQGADTAGVMATGLPGLEAAVKAGGFDDELFYCLGVIRIEVPPLSARPEDIPILFEKFLREEIDAGAYVTSAEGRAAARGLASLDWSGNLRALRNHAKRVAWGLNATEQDNSLKAQLERVERGILQDSLRRHKGNATEAAQDLDLPRKTFYDRLQRLGVKPETYRQD